LSSPLGVRARHGGSRKTVVAELAQQYNPVIHGWWNYYGGFYRTVMYKLLGYIDRKLEQWARRKYKNLSRHKQGSADWLRRMKRVHPGMFFHWSVAGNRVWVMGAV
jgi:hypothetical protein